MGTAGLLPWKLLTCVAWLKGAVLMHLKSHTTTVSLLSCRQQICSSIDSVAGRSSPRETSHPLLACVAMSPIADSEHSQRMQACMMLEELRTSTLC